MTGGNGLAPRGTLRGAALDDLAVALRLSRRSIDIATPFLSYPVARLLIRQAAAGRARQLRLLTAVNHAAVEGGYLDPDAVVAFHDSGFLVHSLRNLHAKLVSADRKWAMVGSGNLTVAGSNGGNAELGVVLTRPQARQAATEFFEKWWSASEPVDVSRLPALRKRRFPRAPERRQRQGQGGFYRGPVGAMLTAARADSRNSGYWLKIMSASDERTTPGYWQRLTWISDRHRLRGSQVIRKPAYAIGDQLVIYLTRGERQACPAIVRVKGTPRYDPELVRKHALKPDNHEKWAWVTDVEVVHAVRSMARAPSLGDIGVAAHSVRQQGHIHLNDDQFRRALRRIRGW
ncbi:MAG: hypothetical protein JOZ07_07605 [Solirubrobacterales bacterium]|nr:hypothetical protein [Solirubrobacterales bacterium]